MVSVLIEMEKARTPFNGLGNFCRNLGLALLKQPSHIKPLFYVPSQQINLFGNRGTYRHCKKWHRLLPQFAPQAALWHITHQDSQYWPPKRNIPLLLTIHDLNFLHVGKSPKRIQAHLKHIQKLIKRANRITTISKYSKQEIEKYLQPSIPIEVIYNGVELNLTKQTQPAFVTNEPYLLALGEVAPKKNFHVLIDFLAKIPDLKLYIVGKPLVSYAQIMQRKIHSLNLQNRIILTGPVSESEKTWLYQNCEAFLFPSLAEGFGLPVIEAMRCGRPVFVSKRTALQEVGGALAYYFESFESDHMLKVFEKGMQDYQSDSNKATKLSDWSKQFTWQRAAQHYLRIYQEILN